jgi:hypothetical protein
MTLAVLLRTLKGGGLKLGTINQNLTYQYFKM